MKRNFNLNMSMKTSFHEFIYSQYILAADDQIRHLLKIMDLPFPWLNTLWHEHLVNYVILQKSKRMSHDHELQSISGGFLASFPAS